VEYTPVRGAGIEYNGSVVVRIQKGFRFGSNVVEVRGVDEGVCDMDDEAT
jgi:hypothetical protein